MYQLLLDYFNIQSLVLGTDSTELLVGNEAFAGTNEWPLRTHFIKERIELKYSTKETIFYTYTVVDSAYLYIITKCRGSMV